MDEVKINTSKTLTLTLPSDPDDNIVLVTLVHEFGDDVSGPTNATRVDAGIYSITYGQQPSGLFILNSAGKHRVDFKYKISGQEFTQSKYINVYTSYLSSYEFFIDYPELEDQFSNKFDKIERQIKNIINTFTGQSFDSYSNKNISIIGNNSMNLRLPIPIYNLKKVTQDLGTAYEEILFDVENVKVDNIEKIKFQPFNFNSTYYVRWKNTVIEDTVTEYNQNKFKSSKTYTVLGDYGWEYVPENIKQASSLLIADHFNDDSAYRRHGIYAIDLDIVKLQTKESFYETTGNIDADVLLMDYTNFIMDYIQ